MIAYVYIKAYSNCVNYCLKYGLPFRKLVNIFMKQYFSGMSSSVLSLIDPVITSLVKFQQMILITNLRRLSVFHRQTTILTFYPLECRYRNSSQGDMQVENSSSFLNWLFLLRPYIINVVRKRRIVQNE